MKVLAIDPGTEKSAWLLYDTNTEGIIQVEIEDNKNVLAVCDSAFSSANKMAIEMIASYGMPVGKEVFETCCWIGRFEKAFGISESVRIYRKDIKLHFCNSVRAKDGNIRQAIIDRFGGKEKAIGKKASQGRLHRITADLWSALAIAIYYADKYGK